MEEPSVIVHITGRMLWRGIGIILLLLGLGSLGLAFYFGPKLIDLMRLPAVFFLTFGIALTVAPDTGFAIVHIIRMLITEGSDVFYEREKKG